MRGLARQIMSWGAIYAVALHVILLGLAPIAANETSVNPFSVICHSVAPSSDEAPAKPDLVPGPTPASIATCAAPRHLRRHPTSSSLAI